MASAFSHAVVALAIGRAHPGRNLPARFWWLSIGCALLPDVDVIGFAFGIEYAHPLGHRGLTHSLVFALLLGLLVVETEFPEPPRGSRRWWGMVAHFFLVTASHGVLDAMTDGGLGVAFFAPFDNGRYFLPWRPVKVSPIGLAEFFAPYGLEVLASEIQWIWLPAGLFVLAGGAYRRFKK
ncbi:metal-dependent hydrolase [Nitrospira sp. Kam-Ns4a]